MIYTIKKIRKCRSIQIWQYTNIHVEKYKYEKCKRVCKESKYKYIKNCKVTPNRNVKPNKEKIYKSSKYIDMCMKIYKNLYIET